MKLRSISIKSYMFIIINVLLHLLGTIEIANDLKKLKRDESLDITHEKDSYLSVSNHTNIFLTCNIGYCTLYPCGIQQQKGCRLH